MTVSVETFARTRAPVVIADNRAQPLPHDAQDDAHNAATIERAFRFNGSPSVARVEVILNPRGVYVSQPEWLEHVIRVVNHDGSVLTVAAIQRAPGAPSEFHS